MGSKTLCSKVITGLPNWKSFFTKWETKFWQYICDVMFFQVVCSSVADDAETTADSRKREEDNNLTTSRRPESTTEPSEGRTQNNSSNNSSFSNLEFLQITPTTIQVKIFFYFRSKVIQLICDNLGGVCDQCHQMSHGEGRSKSVLYYLNGPLINFLENFVN